MSESVSAALKIHCTVTEILDRDITAAGQAAAVRTITHDGMNRTITPTPTTVVSIFRKTMSGGAATIDFTALPTTNGATVDATGLKLQVAMFTVPSTNANGVNIGPGASNGYDIWGASNDITLAPNNTNCTYFADASPDVASGDKTIDIAGTGSQVLDCLLVFG